MGRGIDYENTFSKIDELALLCKDNMAIDSTLYKKYDVKRGLRDISGKGVLAGLTDISDIISSVQVDGVSQSVSGELYYRGINIVDLVEGSSKENRFGFEEVTYLLLFGHLPDKQALEEFNSLLATYRSLPQSFVRDIIMKAPSSDMMNTLARGVLTLYAYDEKANDISIPNVLRQCLELIAMFPLISVYGYNAYEHYYGGKSLFIHSPEKTMSTAENILHLLRSSGEYSGLEAKVLDLALVLHAEHGGGNNSTFTTHVVSSSGTDTYSVIAAALGSLKGPRHGGANIKVVQMFEDMKSKVKDWKDDEEITDYLSDILDKKAFDNSGLIYGVGHAVYSISDPRALVFRSFVEELSAEKGLTDEFNLYSKVEVLAPEVIGKKRNIYKGVSANVDFYSGFAYQLLGLPPELYTPIFAIARIAGWSAHRLEELVNTGKIIRPAYKSISGRNKYIPLNER